MELQELVTTKEMSQRLWDVGVRLETPFILIKKTGYIIRPNDLHHSEGVDFLEELGTDEYIPVYTFQQLYALYWEFCYWSENDSLDLDLHQRTDGVVVQAELTLTNNLEEIEFYSENGFPDLMGSILLWCLENNYIKLEDINE